MVRIKKWQETLVVAWIAFFSLAWMWPREKHATDGTARSAYAQLLTRTSRRSVLGVELTAQRPYVRLVRASLVPISLPLAAGAYLALADSPVPVAATAAPLAGSSCPVCNTATAPCCSVAGVGTCCNNACGNECYTVFCCPSNDFSRQPCSATKSCVTCGLDTCVDYCNG